MQTKTLKVLLVEDEEAHASLIQRSLMLGTTVCDTKIVKTIASAKKAIQENVPDILLTDYKLIDGIGTELIPHKDSPNQFPVIVLTAFGSEKKAVEAIKLGAMDYIIKSAEVLLDMSHIVDRVLKEWQLIIEHNKTLKALFENEQRLRNIIEHSRDMFYSHTTDHILTFISPQVEKIFGYSVEEAKIKWTRLITDNPINQKGFELTEKAIKTGKPQPTYELEIRKKSGETGWVEIREAPVVENGKTVAIVGALTDITQRKRDQEKLIYERDFNRKIAETSPAGIAVVDKNGQITFANKKAEEIFQLSKKEITNRTFNAQTWAIKDFDGNPFPEEKLAFVQVKNKGKSVFDVRHTIEWPNGDRRFLTINASPLWDENGEFDGMVATISDITERQKFITKLQKNVDETSRINRLMVGRENRMIELKEEINDLCEKLNMPPKYSAPKDKK